MSKSLGNVISPQEITKKHGAEILRLWTSSADYREDMRISNEIIARLVEAYRKIRNTNRFLLGNINDIDLTAAEFSDLKKEDVLEIDRYAMSLLQGLIGRATTAYETFAFHEVYHSMYQFCVIDMSAFYLDILKDRLYTFKADSKDRRAAQWVLHNILISLTKIIAPILSFTAEEIWQHIPNKKEGSVFLSSFPEVDPEWVDKELEKKWQRLSKVRDEVNKALEIKRQEKLIGNSLEAKVTLYAGDELYNLLKDYNNFLPSLFIVSSADVIHKAKAPEISYQSPEFGGMGILVEKALGDKCQRCWNWDPSVGTFDKFPELCKKCHDVLAK